MEILDSDSSSDDECNMYINSAAKLKELNQQNKKKDEKKINEIVCIETNNSPLPLSDDEAVVCDTSIVDNCISDVEQVNGILQNKENPIILSDKTDSDPIILLDDDSGEDFSNSKRILRNKTCNTRRNKNKHDIISERVQQSANINDSIERMLNDDLDDSLQLSQEENDCCYVIGSPPPNKKLKDNYEVSVKVLWKSNKVERFEIKRYESFQKIFRHFADLEGVPEDQILITKKGKRITPLDTPVSIEWSIIDIFDGGVVSADIAKNKNSNSVQETKLENSCKIKIQTSKKETLNFTLKMEETFAALLAYCSDQLSIPKSKIKLYFDGELVDIDETPNSLDIDEEACFDLKISE